MDNIAERIKVYIETHPFDSGESDCETVLDQLYQAYAESDINVLYRIRNSEPFLLGNSFGFFVCVTEVA